jgi:hypothetical protein
MVERKGWERGWVVVAGAVVLTSMGALLSSVPYMSREGPFRVVAGIVGMLVGPFLWPIGLRNVPPIEGGRGLLVCGTINIAYLVGLYYAIRVAVRGRDPAVVAAVGLWCILALLVAIVVGVQV